MDSRLVHEAYVGDRAGRGDSHARRRNALWKPFQGMTDRGGVSTSEARMEAKAQYQETLSRAGSQMIEATESRLRAQERRRRRRQKSRRAAPFAQGRAQSSPHRHRLDADSSMNRSGMAGGKRTPLAQSRSVAAAVTPFTSQDLRRKAFRPSHVHPSTSHGNRSSPQLPSLALASRPSTTLGHSASIGEQLVPLGASSVGIPHSNTNNTATPSEYLPSHGPARERDRNMARGRGRSTLPRSAAWLAFAESSPSEGRSAQGDRGDGQSGQHRARESVPVVHFSKAHLRHAVSSEEAKVILMQEWQSSYASETASFASHALAAEIKLRRADVFAESMGVPNPLAPAVAFEILERIAGVFHRYEGLVHQVRAALLPAVYVEARDPTVLEELMSHSGRPEDNDDDDEEEEEEGGGSEDDEVEDGGDAEEEGDAVAGARKSRAECEEAATRRYYRLTTYFDEAGSLRKDRLRLVGTVDRLRSTLVEWEQARQEEVAGLQRRSSVVRRWQDVMMRDKQQRQMESVEETMQEKEAKLRELSQSASRLYSLDGLVSAIVALPTEGDKVTLLERLVKQCPSQLRPWLDILFAHAPTPTLLRLAERVFAERKDIARLDLVRFIVHFFNADALQLDHQLQANLLVEAARVMPDVGLAMGQLLHLLHQAGHLATLRYLLGIDAKFRQPQELNRYLEQELPPEGGLQSARSSIGDEAEQHSWHDDPSLEQPLSLPEPAVLADTIWRGAFSISEQVVLLRSLLISLGGEALRPVLQAILFSEGSLHEPVQLMPDDVREKCLKLLLEDASVELCRRVVPEDVQVGFLTVSSSAEEDYGYDQGGDAASPVASATWSHRPPMVPPLKKRVSHECKSAEMEGKSTGRDAADAILERPLDDYLKRPAKTPRNRHRFSIQSALQFIYELYHAKLKDDRIQAVCGALDQPRSLGSFLVDYVTESLGFPSSVHVYLYDLVQTINRNTGKNRRLDRFGRLVGILGPPQVYSPRRGAIHLRLLEASFGPMRASMVQPWRDGYAFVDLKSARRALSDIFVRTHVPILCHNRLCVTEGRMKWMQEQLLTLASPLHQLEAARAATQESLPPRTPRGDSPKPQPGAGRKQRRNSVGAVLPPPATKSQKRRASIAGDSAPETLVVQWDDLADLAQFVWQAQVQEDKTVLERHFAAHDLRKKNEFSFGEFRSMVAACVGSVSVADELGQAELHDKVEQRHRWQQRVVGDHKETATDAAAQTDDRESRGPISVYQPASAVVLTTRFLLRLYRECRTLTHGSVVTPPDTLSAAAFVALCDRYGIGPPRQEQQGSDGEDEDEEEGEEEGDVDATGVVDATPRTIDIPWYQTPQSEAAMRDESPLSASIRNDSPTGASAAAATATVASPKAGSQAGDMPVRDWGQSAPDTSQWKSYDSDEKFENRSILEGDSGSAGSTV